MLPAFTYIISFAPVNIFEVGVIILILWAETEVQRKCLIPQTQPEVWSLNPYLSESKK